MPENESNTASDNRSFAFGVISRIEANTGLSIRSIFEQEDVTPDEVRRRMHGLIIGYVEDRLAKEVSSEDWPKLALPINAREAIFGNSSMNVIPNVAVTEYNYNIIKGYRSTEIHDYLKRVTNGLSLLNDKMTSGEAAATIIGSGLASFATAMIVGTVKALIAKATFRAAVVAGVKAMGKMSVVVGVAMVIVTEILLYLLLYNKKVFLGTVYNNSSLSLVVQNWRNGVDGANNGDLFMNTGSIVGFMETHMNEKLDSPLIQIMEKSDVGSAEDNIICGGIFSAEKNFGFYGTDGAMVLSKYHNTFPRFTLVFACPYSRDNGVNVDIQTSGDPISPKTSFERLFPSRGMHNETTGTLSGYQYKFMASCADKNGGEASGIATLDEYKI